MPETVYAKTLRKCLLRKLYRGVLPREAACSPRRRRQGLRRGARSAGCTRSLDFSASALLAETGVLVSICGSRPSQSWPEIGSSCRRAPTSPAPKGFCRRHRIRRRPSRVRHDACEAGSSTLRPGHLLPANRQQPLPSRGSLERVRRRRSAGRKLSFALHQAAELVHQLIEHLL